MKGVTINGSRNQPLRGSKRTTLEGGIRVPFVVSWKDKIKPAVYDQPVIQLDLHSTALAIAGLEQKPEWKLDGVNLLPFLTGEKSGAPHDALYWRFGKQMALRMGDWKLVRYDNHVDLGTSGVSSVKLYNLASDIGETNDLAVLKAEKVREMQAKWDAWNSTLVKPLWGGDHSGDDTAQPGAEKKSGRKK
jgi:arylsulfatase A-like enzyme